MKTLTSAVAILVVLVAAAPRAQAQTAHAVTPTLLDQAIRQHVTTDDEARAAVLRVLERDEVKAQADRFGVDLRRASTAVASLTSSDLQVLASQAAQVEQSLAGGQSRVVISTTAIVIGLLVLILLIVALD